MGGGNMTYLAMVILFSTSAVVFKLPEVMECFHIIILPYFQSFCEAPDDLSQNLRVPWTQVENPCSSDM